MARPIPTREQWEQSLYARIHEVGECEEWGGPMVGPTPMVNVPRFIYDDAKTNSKHTVRSVIWFLVNGRKTKPGHVIMAKCCNDRCVKFSHLVEVTRDEANKRHSKAGVFNSPRAFAQRMRIARTRDRTKLTIEIAREIRMSDEPSKVLAERYGVTKESINAIKRGAAWREAANGASVFSWRPAA